MTRRSPVRQSPLGCRPIRPARVYDAGVRLPASAAVVVAAGLGLGLARTAHADARTERDAASTKCDAHAADCDWLATLSSLERASVSRGLAARGYTVEPSPWGKPIGHIYIYNEDVFAEGNKTLRFFNRFHYTTRESTIRDELVIREGEAFDPDLIGETSRRLRDPSFTSVVAIIPVAALGADAETTVDVFVVTRDIWSLRLNTQYLFQEGKLTDLTMSLSENNFLGTRTITALGISMDQGAVAVGPLFVDKNLGGQYIQLRARIDAVLNREKLFDGDWEREGSQSSITMSRQLWSLASKWGAGVALSHRYAIERSYRGTDLRTVDCPPGADCSIQFDPTMVPADEQFGYQYRTKRWGMSAYGVRQLGGKRLKHQVTLGYSVDDSRPRLLAGTGGTAEQRAALAAAILPRSELASVASVSYSLFTPVYKTVRNVSTYDLAEDVRFGPDLDVSAGLGTRVLGGDNNFQRASASAGYTLPWGRDGFVHPSASISTRHQDGAFIDDTATGTLRIVTPTVQFARVVAQTSLSTLWHNTQNTFYTAGSDSGLRGYSINEFQGQRLFKINVEARTIPTAVWAVRLGAVAFYDAAGAADTVKTMNVHHDVGFGFRMLIPQTSREVFRFDLAFPLETTGRTSAGHPRFLAGFESAF